MSKRYELTKQIHELLTQIKTKYGLDIEIKGEYIYQEMLTKDKAIDCVYLQHLHPDFFSRLVVEGELNSWDSYKILPVIKDQQIRQILFALKDILDDIANTKNRFQREGISGTMRVIEFGFGRQPELKAEALCEKWLDGLNPLIESEPEKVLEELKETLTKLLCYD
jgi:hypothetical protein